MSDTDDSTPETSVSSTRETSVSSTPETSVSVADFRAAMSTFVSGVTIVTARDLDSALGEADGAAGDVAMTASSFMSVSLDPPLVAVGVGEQSRMHELLQRQDHWAVSFVPHGQRHLASRFAAHNRPGDRLLFAGAASGRGTRTGALVLDTALTTVECRTEQLVPAGDHLLVIGHVLAITHPAPGRTPLVYFGSRFRRLADLSAGEASTHPLD